ncbi:MAG: hypothetical protein AAF725_04995 [Acidobacteriota bacterium]
MGEKEGGMAWRPERSELLGDLPVEPASAVKGCLELGRAVARERQVLEAAHEGGGAFRESLREKRKKEGSGGQPLPQEEIPANAGVWLRGFSRRWS